MKYKQIRTAKPEILHLSKNSDQCLLKVNEATLKQLEKFKYLIVAFTRDGRQDEELDTQKINKVDTSNTVMRVLQFWVVMKQKIVKKSKALNFQNSFCLHSQLLK